MGALETVKRAISGWLSLEEEETVLYELRCTECETAFTTEDEVEDATCEECGSGDLEEEGRMFVGGGGVEGA